MESGPLPLEPSPEQRRGLSADVMTFAESFVRQRATAPASAPPISRTALDELLADPPENGGPLTPLLERLERAIDTGFDTASGSHMSYIPSGGIFTGALAEFLAAVTNRYTGGNHASPGSIAIEQSVIRWLCSLFGFPPGASGILLSGGSVATLTATVAARARLGPDFSRGVVYASERAHHSVVKAARIAGIAEERVRTIPVDSSLRLSVDALRAALASDQSAGLQPMMVTATAGTTDTGTIDPLPECAQVAAQYGAWFHVDAAYGGFFVLTERGRNRLAGIGLADSITLDAHKSMFLPFGVGGLVVRDGAALVAAHEGRGAYMQDLVDSDVLPQYFALGPELTRPFRGLVMWLPLHLHGVAAFRCELDRMLDLAAWVTDRLAAIETLELAAATELSVVSFRSRLGDDHSQRIFDGVNATRLAHLSSTTIDGRLVIRLALLSQRTTHERVASVVSAIEDLAQSD